MDKGEDAQHPVVRITHHADGTADVNGLPVVVRAGQDVREAAYLAAVAAVSSFANPGGGPPVAAVRVEPDGTQYPLMLYPGRAPFAASPSQGRTRRARTFQTLNGLASLRLRWLAPVACGCVFLTALATVLLRADDPGLVQSKVNTRTAESAPRATNSDGSAVQAIGVGVGDGTSGALISAQVRASAARASAAGTSNARPEPAADAAGSPVSEPSAVGGLTLAMFGGDRDDPEVSYVVTVSAGNTGPITLTYKYSGSKAPGGTRTQVLSGQTEYALAGSIPGRAYCGGTVTMAISSRPRAANGTVTATTMQAC